jgi:hypothetical protein
VSTGTGIVIKRYGRRGPGPEALIPVAVNGGLAGYSHLRERRAHWLNTIVS